MTEGHTMKLRDWFNEWLAERNVFPLSFEETRRLNEFGEEVHSGRMVTEDGARRTDVPLIPPREVKTR